MIVPLVSPIIIFILILFLIIIISGKIFLYFASFSIEKTLDHSAYFNLMVNKYHSFSIALNDIREAFTPTSAFAFIFYKATDSINLTVAISNSFVITGILCINNIFYTNNYLRFKYIHIFQITLATISPMAIQMGVSLNKDFYVSFFLCFSILCFYHFINSFHNFFKMNLKNILKIIYYFILICLGTIYLGFLRWPTASIFLVFILIYLASLFIQFIFYKKINLLFINFIFIICTIVFIFLLKWESLTFALYQNHGNAEITDIHESLKLNFIDTIFYVFKGYFYTFFGIYTSQFSFSNISIIAFLAGLFQNIFFLFLLYLINLNKKNKLFPILFCFICLHIGIQIWGTPNYGNLFRQQIPDIFLIITFLFTPSKSTNLEAGKNISLTYKKRAQS